MAGCKMNNHKFYQGNALDVLKTFPEKSIDMAVTSPPYWGLRDYGIDGQLGLEPTFDLYIKHLCDIFEETKRVLKDEATLWVVLGDTYSSSGGMTHIKHLKTAKVGATKSGIQLASSKWRKENKFKNNIPDKSLVGIPFRFAIEMINRGFILRNVCVWYKNNVMPSSATDRFTVDFEYIFFFSKQSKYYFEQQFEKSLQKFTTGYTPIKNPKTEKGKLRAENKGQYRSNSKETGGVGRINPKGRNKRTVWSIPTKPFKEAHFAVFPEALIKTPILAGCPPKGIVLDMFSGAGTVAVVARKQNKNTINIELNPEYIRMAKRRLENECN